MSSTSWSFSLSISPTDFFFHTGSTRSNPTATSKTRSGKPATTTKGPAASKKQPTGHGKAKSRRNAGPPSSSPVRSSSPAAGPPPLSASEIKVLQILNKKKQEVQKKEQEARRKGIFSSNPLHCRSTNIPKQLFKTEPELWPRKRRKVMTAKLNLPMTILPWLAALQTLVMMTKMQQFLLALMVSFFCFFFHHCLTFFCCRC